MLYRHPAYYLLSIASGARPMPSLPARKERPVLPEGELYVHDILRIIDDYKMKELEQSFALSAQEDAPDAPKVLSEARQHRLFRRLAIGVVTMVGIIAYGSGALPL